MFVNALRRMLPLLALTGLAACHRHPFIPASFPSKEALFQASLQQLKLRHWGNAENGFEKLTTDLPARDPLLPAAYYYLGEAHSGQKEYCAGLHDPRKPLGSFLFMGSSGVGK